MKARAFILLVFLVTACGDKGEAPASGANATAASPDDDYLVERAIRSMATISDLAARHGKNCDALAKDLALHAKRDAPTIAAFKKLLATNQQALTAKYGERIQQVGQAAVLSLRDHCATHPAITNVFKQLE